MEWFFNLEPEEQVFIKKFLLASASLKQLAKEIIKKHRESIDE